MTDVDIDQALRVVEELMESSAPATKPEKPKKAAGYDVYASLKNAAEGKPDTKVESLEKLLNKIGDTASGGADLMSVTVHYARPLGSVLAVSAARPPAKSAVKLLSRLAGKPALSVVSKESAQKMSTFVLSKKRVAPAEAKIKKPAAAAKKEKKPKAETPQVRIEANLKKLQKKQKEKAV